MQYEETHGDANMMCRYCEMCGTRLDSVKTQEDHMHAAAHEFVREICQAALLNPIGVLTVLQRLADPDRSLASIARSLEPAYGKEISRQLVYHHCVQFYRRCPQMKRYLFKRKRFTTNKKASVLIGTKRKRVRATGSDKKQMGLFPSEDQT